LISKAQNLALGVEITLFSKIFAIARSAVLVDTSPGYSTLSPPTVNRTRQGLSLFGRFATTRRRYVGFLPIGTSVIYLDEMNSVGASCALVPLG
jgi:hypothetical protein